MSEAIQRREEFTPDQLDLIKRTICRGASDDELALFVQTSQRLGLDPFARQVFAVFRYDKKSNRNVMSIQTSIDGYRLIAARSNDYAGQVGPWWCGEDGEWRDVWLAKVAPSAARVGVLRTQFREPIYAVARFEAYASYDKDGALTSMWSRLGDVMIAKCAESLALRRAFPAELSGIYTREEMAQADDPEAHQTRTQQHSTRAQAAKPPRQMGPRDADGRTVLDAKASAVFDAPEVPSTFGDVDPDFGGEQPELSPTDSLRVLVLACETYDEVIAAKPQVLAAGDDGIMKLWLAAKSRLEPKARGKSA